MPTNKSVKSRTKEYDRRYSELNEATEDRNEGETAVVGEYDIQPSYSCNHA